jgi:microcystin-dependent protein
LPDLRGRFPVHPGNGIIQGETGGTERVTLTANQIPAHTHAPRAHSAGGNSVNPSGNYWAAQPSFLPYAPAASQNVNMKAGAIGSSGGSQPHNNMSPYLGLNYIISLYGIFPSPS